MNPVGRPDDGPSRHRPLSRDSGATRRQGTSPARHHPAPHPAASAARQRHRVPPRTKPSTRAPAGPIVI
ncbi:conserved hypothetical protein [Streptomyces sviceus ATCC 29083]|uniref:Uncharacterized protein n=1 Tax=Streptomyces sviceus (strain ATCC 29083 / DSM 924 / JCM 4929 / NBRC 13980 / NCIMB 11184 / NRRL 5439 / UC 5370) TaxID=463191 RepID=B5HWN8_STRX2|nr:conserved hypothetical protein [Streptomyces sviceus ATCC 29083]